MTRTLKIIFGVVGGLVVLGAVAYFFVLPRFVPYVFHGSTIQSNQGGPLCRT